MEREVLTLEVQVEGLLQRFNTHGTEITPGSDVIGENLDELGLFHNGSHVFSDNRG